MGVLVRLPQPRTGRFVSAEREGYGVEVPELEEWAAWMRAQGQSDSTVGARTRRIELFAEQVGDPVHATAGDVVAYLASLPSIITRSTRATYYSHLRAWFTWLVKTDRRDDDPTVKVPAPRCPRRQPRPVTDDQFLRVLSTPMRRRTRMMVLLASFQGLRAHEIAKIKGEDIDHTARQLRVLGKGGTDKVLPLHPIVAEYAADFPARGYWFEAQPVGRVGHVHSRSVSSIVGGVLRRAGVPTGGPHRLRHTYATRLVQNGENLRVIQELLRHASLQTTQIYTGVTFEQQRVALDRLGMPTPEDAA